MMRKPAVPLSPSLKIAMKAASLSILAAAIGSCSPLPEPAAPEHKDIARVQQELTPEVARQALIELVTDPTFRGFQKGKGPSATPSLRILQEPDSIKRLRGPITFAIDSRDKIFVGHFHCDLSERTFESQFGFSEWCEMPGGTFVQDESGRWHANMTGVGYACWRNKD